MDDGNPVEKNQGAMTLSKSRGKWRRDLLQAFVEPCPVESRSGHVLLLACTALPTIFAFAVFNRLHGQGVLSMIEFGVCSGLALVVGLLLSARHVAFAIRLFMVLGVTEFFSLFLLGGVDNTGIYWLPILPFVAQLSLGLKRGAITALLILAAIVMIGVLAVMGVFELPYTPWQIFVASLAMLVFSVLATGIGVLQVRREQQLNESLQRLRESEEELRRAHADLEIQVHERTAKLARANRRLQEEAEAKERALEELRESQRNFFQAQKMQALGTLVGGIAHDFNNMLSGITANLYMIQIREKDPDISARLQKVDKLVMHAADMIRQMLTFARQDHVELRHIDLVPFIKEAFKLARVSIPESIDCHLRIEVDAAPIRGDATQLQQLLMNLMNNARDALHGVKRPEIEVGLRRFVPDGAFRLRHPDLSARALAVLSVRDNGCGIPEDKLDRIFEPFFSTKDTGHGTGLGLAMVYGAVQSHGGVIEADSRLGSGTSFRLYFPVAARSKEDAGGCAQGIVRGRGETILLVDDDEYLRDVTREVLEQIDYRVITAVNGHEAVECFREHGAEIDLVVMDLIMPGLNGLHAARRMREMRPDVPIIFLTGYDRHKTFDQEKTGQWGTLIYKPVTVETLSASVRRALDDRPAPVGSGRQR